MPLFKKKPPPVWFVLRVPKSSSSNSEPKREGPYTRAAITQMYGEGRLGDGALIWTNEKIFPNADKPNSFRLVRIMEWRRLDQLPDPVVRQLGAEWQEMKNQQNAPTQETPQKDETSPSVTDSAQMNSHNTPPSKGSPHPPSGGTPAMYAQPHQYQPAPSSMYPAGVAVHQEPGAAESSGDIPTYPPPPPAQSGYGQPAPQHPAHHSQMGALHQPSAYPASAAYPPPAPGAY